MSVMLERSHRTRSPSNAIALRFQGRAIAFGRESQQTRSHTSPERGGRPPSEAKAVGWGDSKIRETSVFSAPTRLASLATLPLRGPGREGCPSCHAFAPAEGY